MLERGGGPGNGETLKNVQNGHKKRLTPGPSMSPPYRTTLL